MNVSSNEELNWTAYNATGIYAWQILGVKRSLDIVVDPNESAPNRWKTASRLSAEDKDDFINIDSLKFITSSYPGYTTEPYSDYFEDGDNDELAISSKTYNHTVTIFPQVNNGFYHMWKIKYIPVPTNKTTLDSSFYVGYYPALAVYIAKNVVLGEMNRLLLNEEDLELASELKNHYALLEQEYASYLNIPAQRGAESK